MAKDLDDMDFGELVNFWSNYIHSELLVGGGKGLNRAVHLALNHSGTWHEERRKRENKKINK